MKIIIITGQTATGKTELALEKAVYQNGEIVNFDSRQIYRHLDIITGKDLQKDAKLQIPHLRQDYGRQAKIKSDNDFKIGYYPFFRTDSNGFKPVATTSSIKLWLYDIVDPKQYFSSYDYASCAIKVIKDIIKRGKTPILVGGTYLYLYHLLYHVNTAHIPPNHDIRKRLNKSTVKEIQNELKKVNNQLFCNLNESDQKNPQRLIRKLEIALHYKKINKKVPVKMQYKYTPFFKKADIEYLGFVYKDKNDAYTAVSKRVEKRVRVGAFDEVKKLFKAGYDEKDPGMKTIGYQEIYAYIKGKITKKQALYLWALHEIQYMKRQLTFMKKDPNIKWREI
ncbi:MAG: hypothetical protein WC489_05710 [Patescibacteria group bacterium]